LGYIRRIIVDIKITIPSGKATLRALLDSSIEINLINQRVIKEYNLVAKLGPILTTKFLNKNKITIYGAYIITSSVVDGVGNNRASKQLFFGADFTLYNTILSIP